MPDLATQLEAATEGSRKLDCFLADGLGWHSANPAFEYVRYWRQFDPKNHAYESISWSPPDDWGGGPWGTKLPHYTTSIDAKLPDENIVSVSWEDAYDWGGVVIGKHWVAVHFSDPETYAGSHRTSEAIARRIAALKAMDNG